jgi:very-short-patch-repair endonuclease
MARIYKKPFKPAYTVNNARMLRKGSTPAEELLWSFLRNRKLSGLKFRRQVPFGRYILDFFCKEKMTAIELDGTSHANQIEYDRNRDAILIAANIKTIRISNKEVEENTERLLEKLQEYLAE